jgi:hypothetical protein
VADSNETRWRARPLVALALRVAIVAIPLASAYAISLLCVGRLKDQIADTRWWLAVPIVVSVVVCFGLERLTRRLLPLAALLKLSMLFPDRAPSRYKVARSAFNVTALRDKMAESPADSASTAAGAALALITALTSHDRRTRGHCERVRVFTELMGEQLRLSREARDKLRWASLLHDIGKLGVASEILNKPAKLSSSEWDLVAAHPDNGARLLGPLTEWLGEWAGAVRQHHEKYDGTGYPDGIAGNNISRAGRIVAIADSYEVMTAHRAYKKPMATVAARAELARCAGTQFDPSFVRAFLAIPLPKLFWAMGPGSLLMNLPLLRVAAETANKGAMATVQTGVTALSTAAVVGGLTATVGVPAVAAPVSVAEGATVQHSPAVAPTPPGPAIPPPQARTVPVVKKGPVAPADPPAPVSSPVVAPPEAAPPSPPVISARVPAAVSGLTALAGDQQVTVSWTAATANGSPITGYTVAPIGPGGPRSSETVTGTTITVTGLTNGGNYTFAVAAINGVGTGDAASTNSVIPAGEPAAVTGLAVARGDQEVTVSWTPADGNGSPVTGYTVTPTGPDGPMAPVTVTGTHTVMTGLINGITYSFAVTAMNGVGTGVVANTSSVVPAGEPAAVTGLAVARGHEQATVSWSAADGNGSPVTSYTIIPTGPSGPLPPVTVSGTSTVITGLTDGSTYTFVVVANNGVGSSPAGTSPPVTPADVPDSVSGLIATSGDREVTVSWVAAVGNGNPVTGYSVTPTGPGGPLAPVTVTGTSTVITGLINGASYTCAGAAMNRVGAGPTATSSAVAPAGVPTAVTGLTAARGHLQATVSWSAADGNGSPVTGYTVTPTGPGGPLSPVTVSGTSTVITGLTNGSSYTFTVVAINAVGSSPAATSSPVVPADVPGAVTGLLATAGDQQVTVSWTAANGNGNPITGYSVTPTGPGGSLTPVVVTGTSTVITGLTNSSNYTFAVTAINSVGTGAAVTSSTVTPAGVPGGVTGLAAVSGNQQVTVSWTAADGNGNPITGYTVTPTGPGGTLTPVTVSGTSTVITGLTNGSNYTFAVTATNSVGAGAAVTSSTVTPAGAPAVVTGLAAVSGNQQVTVSWTAASSNGSPVTGYTITPIGPGGPLTPVTVTGTSTVITGLTNGNSYTFTVTATNNVGTGPAVTSAAVTPAGVPGSVVGLTATRGNKKATLAWSAGSDNGSPITSYTVTAIGPGGPIASATVTGTTAVITGLVNGTSYHFTVAATNAIGSGPTATSNTVIPT